MALYLEEHKALIWDSIPPVATPTWPTATIRAVLRVAKVWAKELPWGKALPADQWAIHQVKGPIKDTGSGDCLFHTIDTICCLLHNHAISATRPDMTTMRHEVAFTVAAHFAMDGVPRG